MPDNWTPERQEAAEFWENARKRVAEANASRDANEILDFSGEIFLEDPKGEHFQDIDFKTHVIFCNAVFSCSVPFTNCTFWRSVRWQGCQLSVSESLTDFLLCKFHSPVDFSECVSLGKLRFFACVFSEKFQLKATKIGAISFMSLSGRTKNKGFCHFQKDVNFEEAEFDDVGFEDVEFDGFVSFNGAIFNKQVTFEKVVFGNHLVCRGTEFILDVIFYDAHFKHNVIFDDATVCGAFDFRCRFDRGCDIQATDIKINRSEEGISLYRTAKNAARARSDSYFEGEYHFREQCAIAAKNRKQSRWARRPWARDSRVMAGVNSFFGRWVYGYGERPMRPLAWGAAITMLCALVYWLFGAVCTDGGVRVKSFGTNLYFSVVTFTTLGYGDFRPEPGWPRMLCSVEAILGAATMATFIVCLTRKYTR
jgi:hypothetical protein